MKAICLLLDVGAPETTLPFLSRPPLEGFGLLRNSPNSSGRCSGPKASSGPAGRSQFPNDLVQYAPQPFAGQITRMSLSSGDTWSIVG
jgi:hypothetical protein